MANAEMDDVRKRAIAAFHHMDGDNDGSLNVEEINRHLGQDYASLFMSWCDGKSHTLSDGLIDLEEWTDYFEYLFFEKGKAKARETIDTVEAWIEFSASDGRRGEIREKAKSLFQSIDTDGSLEVDMDELHHFFGWDNAKRYLENTDRQGDGNGSVSLDEWIAYFDYLFDNDGYDKAMAVVQEIEYYVQQRHALMKPVTSEQKGIVKRAEALFYKLDKNHDRQLSEKELTIYVGKDNAEYFLTHMDHFGDCDGQVDINEWRTYFRSICIMQSYKAAKEALDVVKQFQEQHKMLEGDGSEEDYMMIERADKVFRRLDADDDGSLNLDELALCFESEDAKELIGHVDVWGVEDGIISPEEWRGYFRHLRGTQGHAKAMEVMEYVESHVKVMRRRLRKERDERERAEANAIFFGNRGGGGATKSRSLGASFNDSNDKITLSGGGQGGLTLMEIMDLDLGNARAELVSMNKSHFRDREQWCEELGHMESEYETSRNELEASLLSAREVREQLESEYESYKTSTISELDSLNEESTSMREAMTAMKVGEHEEITRLKVEHQESMSTWLDEASENHNDAFTAHQKMKASIDIARRDLKRVEDLRVEDSIASDKAIAELKRTIHAREADIATVRDEMAHAAKQAETREMQLTERFQNELEDRHQQFLEAQKRIATFHESEEVALRGKDSRNENRVSAYAAEMGDLRSKISTLEELRRAAEAELTSSRNAWQIRETKSTMELQLRDSEAAASLAKLREEHTETMARARIEWHKEMQRIHSESRSAESTKDEASAMLVALHMSHDQINEYKELHKQVSKALDAEKDRNAKSHETMMEEHALEIEHRVAAEQKREQQATEDAANIRARASEEIEALRAEILEAQADTKAATVVKTETKVIEVAGGFSEEERVKLEAELEARSKETQEALRRLETTELREISERASVESALESLQAKSRETIDGLESDLARAKERLERDSKATTEVREMDSQLHERRIESIKAELESHYAHEMSVEKEEWIASQSSMSDDEVKALHALREDFERQLSESSGRETNDIERKLDEARARADRAEMNNAQLIERHRSELRNAISLEAKRYREETAAFRLRWASRLQSASGAHADALENQQREALLEQLKLDAERVKLREEIDAEREKRLEHEDFEASTAAQMRQMKASFESERLESKRRIEALQKHSTSTAGAIERLKKVSAIELRRINETWRRKFANAKLESERQASRVQSAHERKMSEALRRAEEQYRVELSRVTAASRVSTESRNFSEENARRENVAKVLALERSHAEEISKLSGSHRAMLLESEARAREEMSAERDRQRRQVAELETEFRASLSRATKAYDDEMESMRSAHRRQKEEIRRYNAASEAQKRASTALVEKVKAERAASAVAMTSLRRTERQLAATTAGVEDERRRIGQWPLRPLKRREERAVRIQEMHEAFRSRRVKGSSADSPSSPKRRLAKARARAEALAMLVESSERSFEEEVERAKAVRCEYDELRELHATMFEEARKSSGNTGDDPTSHDSEDVLLRMQRAYATKEREWKAREDALRHELNAMMQQRSRDSLFDSLRAADAPKRRRVKNRSKRARQPKGSNRSRKDRPVAFWTDEGGWNISGTSLQNSAIFLEG
eukprot:g1249.t1